MHLDDAESASLKTWIIKRLEDISDADSDVLADYVLALVKSDEPDEQVKQNCLDNLDDFLHEHTATFVNDVLAAITTKSFDPSKPQPSALQPTAPAFNPPSGPTAGVSGQNGAQNTRKRGFEDWDAQNGQQKYPRGPGGDRPQKQMRRGGFEQRGRGRGAHQGMPHQGFQQQGLPQMPTPPPGMPPFDPNNPLATLLAMQAMGFMPPSASPTGFGQQGQGQQQQRRTGERCRDYDNKGFCALGVTCPYEHGNEVVVPGQGGQVEEYDPSNASLQQQGYDNRGGRGRGRGRGNRGEFRGGRGGGGNRGGRADFSSAAPNFDKRITSVVVEQIPEEKFNEEAVREFFAQFGDVEEVQMQAYKRLAVVKYADFDAAKSAYESPKVIFDNRFVKVYWYKPDRPPRGGEGWQNGGRAKGGEGEDTEMGGADAQREEEKLDPEEIRKRQEEAQRLHEEKQQKLAAANAAREELERKMKAQAEERQKLLEKLAAKERARSGTGTPVAGGAADGEDKKPSSQTETLRAKLAELEREAQSMGIDPNAEEQAWGGFPARGRGRGGYRGRGGFQSRGGWRGRGGFAPRGGAVMRLDNRPKNVAVALPGGEEWGPDKDEALRQYLLFSDMMESADVQPHPERKDAALLAFKERYLAENFMAMAKDIPHIGKVELNWVANAPGASAVGSVATPAASTENGHGTKEVRMEEAQDYGRAEVDYDVAEDEAWR
ncbi:hypothetical protein M8818_006560 [Zalaria obscura]|uniref:Uncharacterized protein n=1 Tax=Zalaria obscura TaxID=2024903 RepID=A0ACC3S6Q6_9PEZI